MGICNLLICFLIHTSAIIKSSKETYTAGTFQERLKQKRLISKTEAKSKKQEKRNYKEKEVKGDKQNVSTNNHTIVSCVYDH